MNNQLQYPPVLLLFLFANFLQINAPAQNPDLPSNNPDTLIQQLLDKSQSALKKYNFVALRRCIDSLEMLINPQGEERNYIDEKTLFEKEVLEFYCDDVLGFKTRAREKLPRLIRIAEKNGYEERLRSLYTNMGVIEYNWYHNYKKALYYFMKLDSMGSFATYNTLPYKAKIYTGMGEVKAAKKCYADYLKSEPENTALLISAYLNYAKLLTDLNQADSALYYLNNKKLLSIIDDESIRQADLFKAKAMIYLGKGQAEKAKELLSKGLNILMKLYDNKTFYYDYTDSYNKLGDVCLQKEEYDDALLFYQKALANLVPEFRKKNFEKFSENPELKNIDLPVDLYETLMRKSKVLFLLRERPAYRAALKETNSLALDLVEEIRQDFLTSELDKQVLLSNAYTLYEQAITLAYEEQNYLEAFRLSELSRALNLQNALNNYRIEISEGLNTDEVIKIKQLQNQLLLLSDKIAKADSETLNSARLKKYKLEEEYYLLLDSIRSKNPLLNLNTDISVATIREKLLNQNQALLEYFVGDEYIFAFLLCPDEKEIMVHAIKIDEILRNRINDLRNYVYEEDMLAYTTTAHALYQKLIKPFDKKLGSVDRLVIIPDRELWIVPFNVLLRKKVEQAEITKFDTYSYLIKDFSIDYWFSVGTAHTINQREAIDYDREYLGVAPMFSSTDSSRLRFRNIRNKDEVKIMATYFQSSTLFQDDLATVEHFTKNDSSFQYIHIASHADADVQNPMKSYIVFSNDGSNFKLGLNQLYNMRIPSELVVLSACKTGVGKIEKGEGAISISRGLIHAGAQSVISTMWEIQDRDSREIMELFYDKLRDGFSKDVALQKAQKKFIVLNGDLGPKSWAAFAFYGNTKATNSSCNMARLLSISLILFLGIYYFYKKRIS